MQWLTTEMALLRSLYGTQGAAAVHQALPHRTLAAIRGKAAAEGIKGTRKSTLGKRFARMWPQSDAVDTAIREAYIHMRAKGDIKALAKRLGRPDWWVQKRAATLGVTRTNSTRIDAWTAAEVAIVDEYAAAGLPLIANKLRAAGYSRTPTAIAIAIKRRGIDTTDPDTWTATQLGPLFGRDPKTVADWIERRGLPAKRKPWGPNGRLFVHRKDLRKWIAANPAYIDLRRIDQHWFWDVMFGADVLKMPPRREAWNPDRSVCDIA